MIWLLLPLLLGLIYADRRRARELRRLRPTPGRSYRSGLISRLLPDILTLAALTLILLSLQPSRLTTLDSKPAPAIALVIDVSGSMKVKDTHPDRLSLAKRELLALINNLPDARFMLIPFAGEAVLQVPLTGDREALRFFVNHLHSGLIASKGSAPEEAVLLAQKSLENVKEKRLIVLLSDGERTIANPPPRLSDSTPVYSFMLGTTDGGEVETGKGAVSRADPVRLEAIARQTGGKFRKNNRSAPALFDLPIENRAVATEETLDFFLIGALFLTLLRWVPTALSVGRLVPFALLTLTLFFFSCGNKTEQSRQGRSDFETGRQNADNQNIKAALTAFSAAADNLDGEQRGTALYNQGTLLLAAGQTDAAIRLLEQALLLMPGDEMVRDNLLLALSESSPFSIDQDGRSKPTKSDEGKELSVEQAEQLVNAVHLNPTPPATQAIASPPIVLKEW